MHPQRTVALPRKKLDLQRDLALWLRIMLPSRSEELQHFKTQINLLDYLAAQGFVLDRKRSSRASATMRGPAGEKLIVSRRPNGVWVYFNVHDDRDAGTIIDWVANAHGTDLGGTRKILRQWTGSAAPAFYHPSHSLKASTLDLESVRRSWETARLPQGPHPYLHHTRKIPETLLIHPAIHPVIRTDLKFGNALFPHFNKHGQLTGIEKKNDGFTGFSPGGQKSLWTSQPQGQTRVLILAETAVDALSFQAIHGLTDWRLASLAGQPSPHQLDCLTHLLQTSPHLARVVLAMDHDDAGIAMAEKLQAFIAGTTPDVKADIALPAAPKSDWNDSVKQGQSVASPLPH